MTEDQHVKDSQSDGSKTFINKTKDKKIRSQRPLTKIILRRLPPTMSEEAFLEQVSPIPEHDHFYFAKPDPSLGNNVYSRAYINFVNVEDIYLFRDKFDEYVFVDDRGMEYVGIVEYAPFQRIPKKKKKKDPKCGTIESDPVYQEFLESLTREPEVESQPKLEYSYPITDANDKKVQSTPLLEYLAARKLDKRGRDERRRRENDKRKMRIERKTKEMPIKTPSDISGDEGSKCNYDNNDEQPNHQCWFGEQRIYHKTKAKCVPDKIELTRCCGSDDVIKADSDWDCHFPVLFTKSHSTFTLTSEKYCDKKELQEGSQKSGGDTCFKEDDSGENEVKKIKPREWEKEKASKFKDEQSKVDSKEGTVFESKTFREQRKSGLSFAADKKKRHDSDKKDANDDDEESDKGKKDKQIKTKDAVREQKSKKYSDTRKERSKPSDAIKTDKQSFTGKSVPSDAKLKSLNHDDIKPFTQLPQVKTDDLTRIIDDMEKKTKLEESKTQKHTEDKDDDVSSKNDESVGVAKVRKSSLDSGEALNKEDSAINRQNSMDDRGKSTDRERSEEKEKIDSTDRRAEKRIRNKDRPSRVIYQPGMGKLSKLRLAKEKETQPTAKPVNDSEKKDT